MISTTTSFAASSHLSPSPILSRRCASTTAAQANDPASTTLFSLIGNLFLCSARGARRPARRPSGGRRTCSCAQARVAKLGEADRGGERVKVGADVRQDDAQRRAGVRGSHDGPRRVVGERVVVLSLEVRLVLVVAAAHGLDTPRVDARDDARSPPGRRRPVHALDVVSTARRRLAEDAAVERPVDDRGAMMDRDGTKGRARDGARRRAGPRDIRREHPREDRPPRRGCVWRSSRGRETLSNR